MTIALVGCVLALLALQTGHRPRAIALLKQVPIDWIVDPLDECIWLNDCDQP